MVNWSQRLSLTVELRNDACCHIMYLCFSYNFQNSQRLFHVLTGSDFFVTDSKLPVLLETRQNIRE